MTLYISLGKEKFQQFRTLLPDTIKIIRNDVFSLDDYNRITADFIITEVSRISNLSEKIRSSLEKIIILGAAEDEISLILPMVQRSAKYFTPDYIFKDVYTYIIQHYHYYKNHIIDQSGILNTKIIGSSQVISDILKEIEQYGPTEESVTIQGESGTGKELVAMALHESHMNTGEFIAKNCSAIPENLLESELFGTAKGAFTDSINRSGLFQKAHCGTLFLDEIGEMSLNMQAKLLRVLETKTVTPLGSDKIIQLNTRIVTATSRNLKQMVQERTFREDLYHRINTLMIHIPPLRKRKEDIPHLCTYFLKNQKIQKRISLSAMDILLDYHWPGNIRELKSTIIRASIRSGLDKEIEDRHILFY